MSRPKAIVPDHPWVTPQDKAKRLFQEAHQAKHSNGHAKPAPIEPTDETQYWPI